MSEPDYSDMTKVFYSRLPDVYRDEDAFQDHHLKKYIDSFCAQLQKVVDVYNRIDLTIESEGGQVGDSSDMLNPNAADKAWLEWIAQTLGITITFTNPTEAKVRDSIMPVVKKHTIAGLEQLAAAYLTNQRRVRIVEGKEEGELSFVVHPDDLYWNSLTRDQALLSANLFPLPSLSTTTRNLAGIANVNDATFEGATVVGDTTWVVDTPNATLDIDTIAAEGTKALKATVTADGVLTVGTEKHLLADVDIAASYGNMSASASIMSVGVSSYRLYLRFYDNSNDYVGQIESANYPSDGQWNTKTITGMVPTGATKYRLVVGSPGATENDVVYIDKINAWEGQVAVSWDSLYPAYDATLRASSYPYVEDPLGWFNTEEGSLYLSTFTSSIAAYDRAHFTNLSQNRGFIVWKEYNAAVPPAYGPDLPPWAVEGEARAGLQLLDMAPISEPADIRIGLKVQHPSIGDWWYNGAFDFGDQHLLIVEWYDADDLLLQVDTIQEAEQVGTTSWYQVGGAITPPEDATQISVYFSVPVNSNSTHFYMAEFEIANRYTGGQNDWGDPIDNFDPTKIVKEADMWQPWLTYVGYRYATTWDAIANWDDLLGTVIAHYKVGDDEYPIYYNDWRTFEVMAGFLESPTYDVIG